MVIRYLKIGIVSVLLGVVTLNSIDNGHYYRARLWMQEPRTAKPWVWSLDTVVAGGSSCTGYNACGDKVPVLSIYGPENLYDLGVTVPGLTRDQSQAFFKGEFQITEAQFRAYMNFDYGFFTLLHLPVRNLRISDPILKSSHQLDSSREWQQALTQLNGILADNRLSASQFHELGVGDFTMLAGWSNSNYDYHCVDFIDTAVQAGVLFPTGKRKNPHQVFSMPLGYDGHYAVPLIFDGAVGMMGWINLGIHAEGLFFFDDTRLVRLRTTNGQQGYIRLAEDKAKVDSGTLWDIGGYLKADHICHGFSMLLGYSFDHKQRDFIYPCSKSYDHSIVNNDPMLQAWSMHNLHAVFEYDWANEDNPYGPRLAIEYNYVINGKNIFNTSMTGGIIGLDFEWCY